MKNREENSDASRLERAQSTSSPVNFSKGASWITDGDERIYYDDTPPDPSLGMAFWNRHGTVPESLDAVDNSDC